MNNRKKNKVINTYTHFLKTCTQISIVQINGKITAVQIHINLNQ